VTRDEYLEVLATEAATPTQVGAIIAEFRRLGVVDRGERLAISAALLGLGDLGSTSDLVMGDAGRLLSLMRHVRDRGELPDADQLDEDDDGQDDEQGTGNVAPVADRVTLGGLLDQIAVFLRQLFEAQSTMAKPSD
jgi:hypothetical protein